MSLIEVNECPICSSSVEIKMDDSANGGDLIEVENCPKCGKFAISMEVFSAVKSASKSSREIANISAYVANNQGFNITKESLDGLFNLRVPSITERNKILLSYIANKTAQLGQFVPIPEYCVSKTWSLNRDELQEMIEYLVHSNYIERTPYMGEGEYKLTLNGWEAFEELEQPSSESNQAFIAMWFDDSMMKIWSESISPAIEQAGYQPHRVDQREHNDKIDDEIIAQIRRSKFVVADFTGHRGGVYYEAGFAKGMGLEVIWLCRKDHLEDLHFDIRQYNCIVWSEDNLEKLQNDLRFRIESVFGKGSVI